MAYTILTNSIYQQDIERAAEALLDWDKLSGKTVLISGATGMIASTLIDILMYQNQNLSAHTHCTYIPLLL